MYKSGSGEGHCQSHFFYNDECQQYIIAQYKLNDKNVMSMLFLISRRFYNYICKKCENYFTVTYPYLVFFFFFFNPYIF